MLNMAIPVPDFEQLFYNLAFFFKFLINRPLVERIQKMDP